MNRAPLRALAAGLLVLAAGLLLTACPPPITPDLVNVVQDKIAPVLTITSPDNNSSFRSTLTVAGVVIDSSSTEGDGEGVLESISFDVGGAEYLGRTLIFTDNGIVYDPPDLEFTSYDPDTGAFVITFSTVVDESTGEPALLTGFRQITITATDKKGHSTQKDVTVYAYTAGPYVVITQPEDGKSYESRETIIGKVTNSADTDSTSEVDPDGLSYQIGGEVVQIIDDPANGMTFDITTGEFQVEHQFNPKPTGGITLEVRAKDLAGYEGVATARLVDFPLSGLEFTEPGTDPSAMNAYFYSTALSTSAEKTITVTGMPLNPAEIQSIEWDVSSANFTLPLTDLASQIGYDPGVDPAFSFPVDLNGDNVADDPYVSIRISSYDNAGRLSPYTFKIYNDPDAPEASAGNVQNSNTSIHLIFDDGLWGGIGKSGPVTAANFDAVVTGPTGGLSAVIGNPVGLVGGETSFDLPITISGGLPDTGDMITVTPAAGNAPRDKANNPWDGSPATTDMALSDQHPPTIQSVDIGTISVYRDPAPAGGTLFVRAGATVDFDVTFSEPVTITGNPQLLIDVGGSYYWATASPGTGTTHSFVFTVLAGHNTPVGGPYLSYYYPYNLYLGAATIVDGDGNSLDPILPAPSLSTNVTVDTVAPTLGATSLSASATGGTTVVNYLNGTNTNVALSVGGIDTITDPSLVGGYVEIHEPDNLVPGSQTAQISGATANFNLLATAGTSQLQAALPASGSPYTLRTLLYDAAGNASSVYGASILTPITADYTPPGVPTSIDATATGGFVEATDTYVNVHNTNINIALSGMPTAGGTTVVGSTAELLVNGSSFSPPVTSGTISAATAAFSIGSVPSSDSDIIEGTNTFTVRLTDAAGNVGSASAANDALIGDFTRPGITTALSLDSSASGYGSSDTMEVEFDESVDDSTVSAGSWSMRDNGAGVSDAFSAYATDVSVVAVANTADDEFARFTLTPVNIATTGTMQYNVGQDSIRDIAGNGINAVSWATADDGAGPWVTSATSQDNNGDGVVDRVLIVFSESIDDSEITEPSTGWFISSDGGSSSDQFNNWVTGTNNDDNGRFEFVPSNVDGTGVMQITWNAGTVKDRVNEPNGNPIPANSSWTAITVVDDAKPRVRAQSRAFDLDDGGGPGVDGAIDAVELWFSEPILDSSVVLDDGLGGYYWNIQVDQVGGSAQVTGNFTGFNTAVSSFTDPTPVNDEYMTFTFTPPGGSVGTGNTQIYFDTAVFSDLAGNQNDQVTSGSPIQLDDYAAAVLMSVTIDDQGTAGLFNSTLSTNDTLYAAFSENIATPAGWSVDAVESFFQFGGATPDNNLNFHDTGPGSFTLSYQLLPNDYTVRIRVESISGGGASDELIVTGSTMAVVANTYTGGIEFNDANGFPVHTDSGQTANFSILGAGAGTAGRGGVTITGAGGTPGVGSRGTPVPLLSDTFQSQAIRDDDKSMGETPYRAPIFDQLEQADASVGTNSVSRAVSDPLAAERPVAGIPQVDTSAPVKVAIATPKHESEPVPETSEDVSSAVVAPSTNSVVAPATEAEIAQVRPDQAPATRNVTAAAGTAEETRPAISTGTAMIGLVAILLIIAGGALLVMSRFGAQRKRIDGDDRA